ncbi:MAG: tRNA lysidine(34) synthetase TilS [Ignavibacteria bacterium]
MESSKSRCTEPAAAVEGSLDRHVRPGQAVVLGLSGGIDSVVLLDCLRRTAPGRHILLSCLHVNHGLSPNADRWEAHCRHLCEEWQIPLIVTRVTVERGSRDGLEAAARRARHQAFAATPADWIALAHHRDDQSETLLFNLLRGTGLAGAAAMAENNGRLLRPLLDIARRDLLAHASEQGLSWIEDESNADTRFARNHLRHEVLAGLDARFPGASANLAAAARRFGEARDLLDDLAATDLAARPADFPLDISTLRALSEPRARNVLRYLLQRRQIGIPSEERLRELLRQLLNAAPDRHPDAVFGSWRIFRKAGKVFVEAVQDAA